MKVLSSAWFAIILPAFVGMGCSGVAVHGFGISGWMRSRGLGIATTSLSLLGALAVFAALRPFLHVVPTP